MFRMKVYWLVLLGLGLSASLWGQEICDNGVDDNGNGLIDLQDPFCTCSGIYTIGDLPNTIPNPSFEDMVCCPASFGDMPCVGDWENGNAATTDYMHTCGFIMTAVNDANLVPFPNGGGILGMVFTNDYKEYASVCLNQPLVPGGNYTLTFRVAFVSVNTNGTTCVPPPNFFSPVALSLFGHPTCSNLTVGGIQCPTTVDPDWVLLGDVTHGPVSSWQEVTITFTPSTAIEAIMIGPPCNMPPGYNGTCQGYFLFDDLSLFGEELITELDITTLGLPCDDDFSLYADTYAQGGQWQWYYNGVALAGQNDPVFPVSENQYQSGTYQVTYSTPNGCIQDSITVVIPPRDTSTVSVIFCPGASVSCAGQQFFAAGEYEVTLLTAQGCDSIVRCLVAEYPLAPVTELVIDTCGPVDIIVCNEVFSETGFYEVICPDFRGCDSLITLDLRVMTPEVMIAPPGVLDCSPGAQVLLDGSASLPNFIPGGTTTYQWTGPSGGFLTDPTQAVVLVQTAGTYCLEMTFAANGLSCSDVACVTVQTSSALPDKPQLTGPTGGCAGDTLSYSLTYPGAVPITGYTWFPPAGQQVLSPTDSTLLLVLGNPGMHLLCGAVQNECGLSDTICLEIRVSGSDTLFLSGVTCLPGEAGVFLFQGTDQQGCDSIVLREVLLLPSYFQELVTTTCDPAQAGSDTLFLSTQAGCDSVIIRRTDLLPSQEIQLTFYTCDPSATGQDTLFLTNQWGCDSTVFVQTLYSGVYQETSLITLCSSGVGYTDTLIVSGGPCDSLFITQYVFVAPDTTYLQGASCDPAQVGVFSQLWTGSGGCDSLVITTISLLPSDQTAVQAYTCVPGQAGVETFVYANQAGCDSVVTLTTLYVGVDTLYQQAFTCEPSQAGQAVFISPGPWCDTVLVVETLLLSSSVQWDTVALCGVTGPAQDTLFLQNAGGCDSLVIRVYTYFQPGAEVQVLPERCSGQRDGSLVLTPGPGGLAPYRYRLEGGSWQSAPVFEGLAPGTYTLYIEDALGCADTLSGWNVAEGIVLTLDAGPDRVASAGSVLQLEATASQAVLQWQWTALDPLSCVDCRNPRLGPLSGSQVVRVSAWSAGGCQATDELLVQLLLEAEVYIPGGFSPNGDGINDVFSVYANDQVRRVRQLAVYDRWGNALYFQQDLPVNDPNAGWDGHYRGKPMDPGVYVWVVEVEHLDGRVQLYKGDVTLVR